MQVLIINIGRPLPGVPVEVRKARGERVEAGHLCLEPRIVVVEAVRVIAVLKPSIDRFKRKTKR